MSAPDLQSHQCPITTHKVHYTPWERAINLIYESDYTKDAIEFEEILKDTPELLSLVDGGFGLVHFLFDSSSGPWENGLAAYLSHGGDISLKTCDYLTSLGGAVRCGLCIVGGRSVLHVAATKLGKNTDIFDALCVRYPGLEVADLNGAFPRELLGYRDKERTEFKAVLARDPVNKLLTEFKAVLARNPVKLIDLRELKPEAVTHLPVGEIIDLAGVRLFSVRTEFVEQLQEGVSAAPVNIPNSMHRYGKVLLPVMDGPVRALCAAVLPEDAIGRVKHIHAFSVKYSHSPGIQQTNRLPLERHRDDSDFTINVCLSSDSRGGNLVFDASGVVYTHKAGRGLIHTGDLEHHVDELETGDRECVIIWVRLSKPSSPACSSNKD
jgi:hypothetical protein